MRCELYGRNFYALTHKYGLGRGIQKVWLMGGEARMETAGAEDRRAGHGVSPSLLGERSGEGAVPLRENFSIFDLKKASFGAFWNNLCYMSRQFTELVQRLTVNERKEIKN